MTIRRAWAWGLAAGAAVVLALDLAFPLPPQARPDPAAPADRQSTLLVLAADGTPLRAWASADGALRHPSRSVTSRRSTCRRC